MLEDKISQYLDVITRAAVKAGPQVMQFAIQHEYWCGVGDLAIGGFLLLLSIGLAIWLKKGWDYLYDYAENPAFIFVGVGAIGTFIGACCQLLDIWNWVAVINPKIALFHDLLSRFLDY